MFGSGVFFSSLSLSTDSHLHHRFFFFNASSHRSAPTRRPPRRALVAGPSSRPHTQAMVGQPWRHETAAAKETSDDSDEIDSEVESDYEEKLFGLLQSGKHRVRNPDGTFRCPFCPGKKKQNYQFKDLLQHADGIGARHRAFARFVRTDPSFAHDHAIINDKSEHGNYKNLLQQLLQQRHKPLPSYYTLREGQPHRPKFTAFVVVDGQHFPSYYHYHARVKDAEQDAARVAYSILVGRQESDHVNVTDELELTDQDVKFSKSILHDFAAKTAANQPCYTVFNPEVSSHRHLFVASVRFAGHTYTGEYATKKKDAEQKAARVAVKSILATKNTCMVQIIRSKKNSSDLLDVMNEITRRTGGTNTITIGASGGSAGAGGSGIAAAGGEEDEECSQLARQKRPAPMDGGSDSSRRKL